MDRVAIHIECRLSLGHIIKTTFCRRTATHVCITISAGKQIDEAVAFVAVPVGETVEMFATVFGSGIALGVHKVIELICVNLTQIFVVPEDVQQVL